MYVVWYVGIYLYIIRICIYIYIILMLYTYIKTHVQDAWQLKCVPSRRSLAPDLNVEEQKNLSDRQMEIGWWAWVTYQKSSRWWYSRYEQLNVSPQIVTSEQNIYFSYISLVHMFRKPIDPLTIRDLSDPEGVQEAQNWALCPAQIPWFYHHKLSHQYQQIGVSCMTHPNIKWIGDISHQHHIISQVSAK